MHTMVWDRNFHYFCDNWRKREFPDNWQNFIFILSQCYFCKTCSFRSSVSANNMYIDTTQLSHYPVSATYFEPNFATLLSTHSPLL